MVDIYEFTMPYISRDKYPIKIITIKPYEDSIYYCNKLEIRKMPSHNYELFTSKEYKFNNYNNNKLIEGYNIYYDPINDATKPIIFIKNNDIVISFYINKYDIIKINIPNTDISYPEIERLNILFNELITYKKQHMLIDISDDFEPMTESMFEFEN